MIRYIRYDWYDLSASGRQSIMDQLVKRMGLVIVEEFCDEPGVRFGSRGVSLITPEEFERKQNSLDKTPKI